MITGNCLFIGTDLIGLKITTKQLDKGNSIEQDLLQFMLVCLVGSVCALDSL
jgi:hypothetical protein